METIFRVKLKCIIIFFFRKKKLLNFDVYVGFKIAFTQAPKMVQWSPTKVTMFSSVMIVWRKYSASLPSIREFTSAWKLAQRLPVKGFSKYLSPQKIKAANFVLPTYLPTILRGCVPPLLEVALHVGPPSLSMLCIMSPCYTLQLYQVVSPSLTLPSPRSSALSWLPLGYSLCPSIII